MVVTIDGLSAALIKILIAALITTLMYWFIDDENTDEVMR
jgi:hypothetical protein